jgi:hypothetical protein
MMVHQTLISDSVNPPKKIYTDTNVNWDQVGYILSPIYNPVAQEVYHTVSLRLQNILGQLQSTEDILYFHRWYTFTAFAFPLIHLLT